MHIDDERIQRLLHGELSGSDELTIRGHLAECADCRSRLAQAQRDEAEVDALLREIDHPVPTVTAAELANAAQRRATPWLRWAAMIALALGVAGAAYAIPGSPLRRWVNNLSHRAPPAPPPPPTAPPQFPDSTAAGIALAPGIDFVVRFTNPQPIAQIDVLLTEGAEVEVRALSGTATFSAGSDRLVVEARGRATFEVRIPRTAPRVQLMVGDKRILLKEGSHVVTEPSGYCRSASAVRYVCQLQR